VLSSLARWGSLLVDRGRVAEAVAELGPVAAVAAEVLPGYEPARWGMFVRAFASARGELAAIAELPAIERDLQRALAIVERARGARHEETRQVLAALARLEERWETLEPGAGHADRATAWREREMAARGK
jgi:hypothetical protein